MKKKYRVREGSLIDWFRYGAAGFMFGVIMGAVINSVYPM